MISVLCTIDAVQRQLSGRVHCLAEAFQSIFENIFSVDLFIFSWPFATSMCLSSSDIQFSYTSTYISNF